MQPNMMASQMTEEQAIAQIKLRRANLAQVLKFKTAENAANKAMLEAIDVNHTDLADVFTSKVVNAYKLLVECRIGASDYEIAAITKEIAQADQLLAQAASPILVPGGPRVMGGGGIRQF